MLDQIRPGDIIVVCMLDRLARSTRDLLNTMDTINEAGGKFQSIFRAMGQHHNTRQQDDHDGFPITPSFVPNRRAR
jgi:DNA invertase Pin-like site-specific DNA recombinase